MANSLIFPTISLTKAGVDVDVLGPGHSITGNALTYLAQSLARTMVLSTDFVLPVYVIILDSVANSITAI